MANSGGARLLSAAGSCAEFRAAAGVSLDEKVRKSNVGSLLEAAESLAGERVTVVAVDMPMARSLIVARRVADNRISMAFGGKGCSTHSPTAIRPGDVGRDLHRGFQEHGYNLITDLPFESRPSLIEVFPHVALLRLLGAEYRIPYKVGKTTSYWPGTSRLCRVERLIEQWLRIVDALGREITGVRTVLSIPPISAKTSLASLKSFEDSLDAAICAWVGLRFMRGLAEPYGNEDAAIWAPTSMERV